MDSYGNYIPLAGFTIPSNATPGVGVAGYHGTGAPASTLGLPGSTYINDTNGDFYAKSDTLGWHLV